MGRTARVGTGAGILLLIAATAGAGESDREFREQVAPILERRCLHCHSAEAPKGGLSLASQASALKGGQNGPAIVPGEPGESLLIEMVSGESPEMPKKDKPLSGEQVKNLRRWVEQGARWPVGVVLEPRRFDGEAWWAFRPLARPKVPAVRDAGWTRTPIDAFILARLEAEGLRPRPEADRRTLIRRLTFDLHGLPPSPGDIERFLADRSPDAYDRLVDRLLASPRYGERWGRHWLDVAHYGDTHGYDKDKRRDHAWPYRDYVIRSLNEDIPYSRFVREQIAGDVIEPGEPRGLIAAGFVAAGPWDFVGHAELREGTVEKEKTRLLDRDDMVSSTMSTFVSLTVHCARCHDHKFDPIPQRDYYRLQAVFAGVERGDRRMGDRVVYSLIPHAPRTIAVLRRGEVEHPGQPVGPGALSCVPGLEPAFSPTDDEGARRAALADWVASPANMLTWRSIANRVWQYHFGRGLVETPNDFGRNGARPTHPELLDWLAVELRDGGGTLKALHRRIVASASYRQSSATDAESARRDADNRWIWRMDRRRLDAEELRDGVLLVSGDLDSTMGGPGYEPFRFKDDHSPIYDHTAPGVLDHPGARRRAVYRFIVRSVPDPFLECLDSADPNQNTPVRSTTITALQALAMHNDAFMIRESRTFARRLEADVSDPDGRIVAAFSRALGRPPRPSEREALAGYAREHGLANACRVLFNTNEFLFVD